MRKPTPTPDQMQQPRRAPGGQGGETEADAQHDIIYSVVFTLQFLLWFLQKKIKLW